MKVFSLIFAFFVIIQVLADAQNTIWDTLNQPPYNTLASSFITKIDSGSWIAVLDSDTRNFTVFVPTNEGIANFDARYPGYSTQNVGTFVGQHLALGVHESTDLSNELILPTEFLALRINIYGSLVTAGGVEVDLTRVDIQASNGVIHFLVGNAIAAPLNDKILALVAGSQFSFSTFRQESGRFAEITARLNSNASEPYTAFIPNNSAFTKLNNDLLRGKLSVVITDTQIMENIFEYHIVSGTHYSLGLDGTLQALNGDNLSVNSTNVQDASIVTADIPVTNGAAHEIDTVLIPPNAFPTLAERLNTAKPQGTDFSSFESLLNSANTVDLSVANGTTYTLIAPTNQAITNLGGTVLTSSDVNYHIVTGDFFIEDLQNEQLLPTLQGQFVRVNTYGSNIVTLNGNIVSRPDYFAINGAFLVLQTRALLPPTGNAFDIIRDTGRLQDWEDVLTAGGLTTLLTQNGPFTVLVPNNNAILNANGFDLDTVKGNSDLAEEFGRYHILQGTWFIVGFDDNMVQTELRDGRSVFLNTTGSTINNGVKIETTIVVTNGIVHIIEGVLDVPETPEPTTPAPTEQPTEDPADNGSSSIALKYCLSALLIFVFVMLQKKPPCSTTYFP